MKQFYVALILSCISFTLHAKIWRVDNRPGYLRDFAELQEAHDGASAGDTIMVSGSEGYYNGITCIKPLVWLGPGYFLRENYPAYPNSFSTTLGGHVFFNPGSEGSIFVGFDAAVNLNLAVSNITVSRIRNATVSVSQNIQDILISSCYAIYISLGSLSTNVVITNNVLRGVDVAPTAVSVIRNNIFSGSVTLINQSVTNNIHWAGTVDVTGSSCANNIDATVGGTSFGTLNGNLGNVDRTAIFVGDPTLNDAQCKLKPNSPAIGAGQGGTDCGIFGGISPYVLSGLPPIPVITKIINSGVGSNTTPLNITISVKSVN